MAGSIEATDSLIQIDQVTAVAEKENISSQGTAEESDKHEFTFETIDIESVPSTTGNNEQEITVDSESVSVTEHDHGETESQKMTVSADFPDPEEGQEAIDGHTKSSSMADTEESDESGEHENLEPQQAGEGESLADRYEHDRQLKLPLSRIKHIIKMDPDVTLASQEAVVTIARAAELFIGTLTKDASYKTVHARRRIVLKKDLDHMLDTRDCYAFLEGAMDS